MIIKFVPKEYSNGDIGYVGYKSKNNIQYINQYESDNDVIINDIFLEKNIMCRTFIFGLNLIEEVETRLLEENNCPTVWINIVKVNNKKKRIMLPLDYQDDYFAIYLDYNDNDDVDSLMFDIYNACLQKEEIELEITFNI